jgi:hypothetical protein
VPSKRHRMRGGRPLAAGAAAAVAGGAAWARRRRTPTPTTPEKIAPEAPGADEHAAAG